MEANELQKITGKLKFVTGANFVTVEDTNNLTENELIAFIENLHFLIDRGKTANVNILIDEKFSGGVGRRMTNKGFHLHDEVVSVYKDLTSLEKEPNRYAMKTLQELSTDFFKKVWTEVLQQSYNAPSSLRVEEQLQSAEIELGPSYKKSCMVAFENKQPLGVIMPHLEPGTKEEGRLFYFGLVPNERGKGKSVPLHQQALQLLKYQFGAAYYIGSTSLSNLPMIRTFVNNGCEIIEKSKVYKWTKG